jgi:excisionase family DNA binding protein
MVANDRQTNNSSLPESPRDELAGLIDDLRGEIRALQEEVQSLRKRQAPNCPDALLTRDEAADILSISTRTLDDLADAGEIQPVRIGGRVLYSPETLDAYIRRRAGGGAINE